MAEQTPTTEENKSKEVFEQLKDRYASEVQKSISFVGKDLDFFTQVKVRNLLSLASRLLGDTSMLRVLDVGCGVGLTDRYLVSEFGELSGVDIAPGVIEKARDSVPLGHYQTYDGKNLLFADGTFDLVFAICVLHHVPPSEWPSFLNEMARVVKPGGLMAIFEHNPFNPLTRLAVFRCPCDRDAKLLRLGKTRKLLRLAGLRIVEANYILSVPFSGTVGRCIDAGLRKLPWGAQYYVVGRK